MAIISVIGLSHHTASVYIREKVKFSGKSLQTALNTLSTGCPEVVLLSTCNRTEIYTAGEGILQAETFLRQFVTPDVPLYTLSDQDAASHLFKVASGLNSQVLGESEILSQVKNAYEKAKESGATGPYLNSLFQRAVACGKRVRTETAISRGAGSVGSAAVALAKSIFSDLSGKSVLIVGAGKIGEICLTHLKKQGAAMVFVANRTYENAVNLAGRLDACAAHFDRIHELLLKVDIVISSTSAPHIIFTKEMVGDAMRGRKNKPLFLIDIAVPRDVAENVSECENVFAYNIDDLKTIAQNTMNEREKEVVKAKEIIKEEVLKYAEWARKREALSGNFLWDLQLLPR